MHPIQANDSRRGANLNDQNSRSGYGGETRQRKQCTTSTGSVHSLLDRLHVLIYPQVTKDKGFEILDADALKAVIARM